MAKARRTERGHADYEHKAVKHVGAVRANLPRRADAHVRQCLLRNGRISIATRGAAVGIHRQPQTLSLSPHESAFVAKSG